MQEKLHDVWLPMDMGHSDPRLFNRLGRNVTVKGIKRAHFRLFDREDVGGGVWRHCVGELIAE